MVKYNFKERETKGEKREEKSTHTYMLWFNLKETGDCSGRGECS